MTENKSNEKRYLAIQRSYGGGGGVVASGNDLDEVKTRAEKFVRGFSQNAYYAIYDRGISRYDHLAAFKGDEVEFSKNNGGVTPEQYEERRCQWDLEDEQLEKRKALA